MEASLTCAVCLGLFQEPVTLPRCSHNFCKSCIQDCAGPERRTVHFQPLGLGAVSSSGTVSCPLCRKISSLPGGVDSLPINTTLAEVVRLLRPAARQEGDHEKGAAGSEESSCRLTCAPCGEHPGREMQLYCKNCAVPCCGQCVSERHQGFCHSVNLLDMVYQEEKLTLFSSLKKLCEVHEKLTKEISDEKDSEMTFINEANSLTSAFEQIQKALDLRKKQLMENIEWQKNKSVKEYNVWKQMKDHQKKSIERLLKDCERIVDDFEPQSFLQVACDLNRRINSSLDIVKCSSDHSQKKCKWGPNHVDLQPTLDAISGLQITTSSPNDIFAIRNEVTNVDFSFKTIARTWQNGECAYRITYCPAQDQELDYSQGRLNKVNVRFASISAMPEYKNTSCEELRLKYYENSITDENKNVFSVPGRRVPALPKISDKHLHSRRIRTKKSQLKRQEGFDEGDNSVAGAGAALMNFSLTAIKNENKTKPAKDNPLSDAGKVNTVSNTDYVQPTGKLPKCLQGDVNSTSSRPLNCMPLKKDDDTASGDNMSVLTTFNIVPNDQTFIFKKQSSNASSRLLPSLFLGQKGVQVSHDHEKNEAIFKKSKCTPISSAAATGFSTSSKDSSTSSETPFFMLFGNTSSSNNAASVFNIPCNQVVNSTEVNEDSDVEEESEGDHTLTADQTSCTSKRAPL
ncbi:uncharacterized protein O3C94_010517 isoform 2-T2 [Discoglossus pictus]